MRAAFPALLLCASPALAADDATVTRGAFGVAVIVGAFAILAFIGSRK